LTFKGQNVFGEVICEAKKEAVIEEIEDTQRLKLNKDGTCSKCPEYETASEDFKTCVDPTCGDQDIFTKLGACKACPEYKTASKDFKACVSPTCGDQEIITKLGGC